MPWSEGTDNGRQKTRNHGYDVIVGGESYLLITRSPRKLVTLNPKLKSTGADATSFFPRWWDAYRKQLGLKDFSPKSQTLWYCSEIGGFCGALPMIDRWYPSGNGPLQQYLGFTAGRWLYCPEHKWPTAWLQNLEEAGGTVREIDVYEQSHRDYLRLSLSASSSACHGLLTGYW